MTRKIAYSLDLREANLNFIPSGKTHSDGVWPLSISRSSLVRWLKRPLLAPSLRGGKKSRDLGVDLQEFLKNHPGKTLAQWSLLLPLKNRLGVSSYDKKINLTGNPT